MENEGSVFAIRKAVITDCPAIMTLIKELAEFEKMPDQVEMTVDQLREDGFSENPKFQCLIAEDEQVPWMPSLERLLISNPDVSPVFPFGSPH